jgi:hypothetical protein
MHCKMQLRCRGSWLLQTVDFICSLHDLDKKSVSAPIVVQSRLNGILSAFNDYRRIHTDGTKKEVAAAAVSGVGRIKSLSDNSFIFTAEAQAILLAMDVVAYVAGDSFLVLSDSLSSLKAI